MTIADRQRIEAYVDAHPKGVTPGQIVGFCLTNTEGRKSSAGLAALVRAYLDDLVQRGELVSWLLEPSLKTGWRKDMRLYARKLPAGIETAFRGDGTLVEIVREVGRVRE
jgi:hypothetical protein